MLNDLTISEAAEVCTQIRDKLELDPNLPLKERWLEKDALALIINMALAFDEVRKNGKSI